MVNLVRKTNRRHPVLWLIVVVLPIIVMLLHPKGLYPLWQVRPELSTQQADDKDLRLLEPGKSFDWKLLSGQTRSFRISLESGQYLRLIIDHWGIDIDVIWYGPSGQKITEVGCRRSEPTPVTLIAEASGTYHLKLRASEKYPAHGRCQMIVEGLRVATAKDTKRILAEQAAAEAERLRWEWKEVLSKRAIQKYEEALGFWRNAGERREESVALRYIGQVHLGLGRSQEALKYFHQALQITKTLKDLRGEGEILNDLGSAYCKLDENQKALDYCTRALTLSQQVGDRRMEAQALYSVGEIYSHFGNISKSLNFYQQALSFWGNLGDPRGQALALQDLGFVYHDLSEYSKALESFSQALDLWRSVGDRRGQALSLIGLGHVYSLTGEKQEALNRYEQANPLIEAMGDHYWEVGLVHGLAYVYDELGEKQRALEYYKQGLHLNQAVSSREGEAHSLWEMGRIYFSLGDKPRALACLQSTLKIFGDLSHEKGISIALRDIGTIYESIGKRMKALEYYHRALNLNQKGGFKREEATTLNQIGHVYWKLGDEQQALGYYKQALSLHRAAMNSFGESLTLYNLAVLERTRGNLAEARLQLEAALQIVESLRGKVASQDLRSSYFASEHQRYDFYIDLLMEMHKQHPSDRLNADALQASERARARSLLENLAESRADIRQGVDPSLLERERSLRQLLNGKGDRRMHLSAGKPDEAELSALDKEIRELTAEYEQMQAQIRSKSPRYAALMQPQSVTLQEIQHQVLDDDSLLLEYALGDERSYLWAVTPTSMSSHELPSRAEIEKAAQRVRELLIARQPKAGETAKQHHARVSVADAKYGQEAATLSQVLLGPVADQLRTKRLLIVAEGALQYLPFGSLPTPFAKSEGREAKAEQAPSAWPSPRVGGERESPLIVGHEIVNLPSASALTVLRREIRDRQAAGKAVAVLADPVFEADDPRIKRATPVGQQPPRLKAPEPLSLAPSSPRPRVAVMGSNASLRPGAPVSRRRRHGTHGVPTPPTPPSDLHRALRDVGISPDGLSIPRLLSSRQEAEAIMAVAPAGAAMRATDFRASRATATSPELGQYRIVHFATHGLLDSEHPELSGLVLSLLDEQGKPQDGFLRLHDIYNLNLPADLVVLSACNTGLGKEIRGEGLVGIVRGFMYAGAARVVASLWKVDDEATAELMKRFYQQMLQEGKTPAAALRAAQVEMWQQKRWHSPYYWAAFVLQGEWK
jgi:CHAT domain-containing protein/tetratricopeptide (TPR) repeat protein